MEQVSSSESTPEPKIPLKSWAVPFFTIWAGQAVSLAGSRVTQFALVWWLTKTTGSATVLATATLVAIVPEILLGPLAGAYVDRWNRRVILIVADSLIALASLWLAYMFWTGSIQVWQVYAVMVVRAIGGSFHWPAMHASTSLMVPKEHLARVAGLNQTLNGVLSIVSPPLGALLMEVLPLYGVMLVDVVTATIAILPLFFVFIPQPQRQTDPDAALGTSVWVDIRAGLRYIRGWPGLMMLIIFAMILKIALTPAFALIPLLVNQHFLGEAAQLSLLEATAGIGIVLGGVVLSIWGGFRKKIYTIGAGLFFLGVGLLLLGVTPASLFWLALLATLIIGFMIPIVDGPIMAILQGNVAPDMQGRVFTLMGSLVLITSPIGLLIAGPASDLIGIQIWFILAGVLCAFLGVAGLFLPAMRNIEENGHGEIEATGTPVVQPVRAEA